MSEEPFSMDRLRQLPDYVLEYLAPMHCMTAERAELLRRREAERAELLRRENAPPEKNA